MAVNIEAINGEPVSVQGSVQQPAPFEKPPVQRRPNGTLLPGSQLAFKNGSRARLPIEARTLLAAEIEAAIVADLGGDANVGTVLRQAVRRYARLSAACEHVEMELATNGALTKSYAVRRNVDYWIRLNASALAWARVIGTRRLAKDIGGMSIDEYLAAEAQAGAGATHGTLADGRDGHESGRATAAQSD